MDVTLSELIIALGIPGRDNVEGVTTSDSGNPLQLADTRRKGQVANTWNGSEVLFPDTTPPNGLNPKRVVAFDNSTGTFTLDDGWDTGSGVPANTRYVLLNVRGKGLPYDYRLQAVVYALETMANQGLPVEVPVVGGAVSGQYYYTIPSGIDIIHTVSLRSPSGSTTFWELELPGNKWDTRPGRQLLVNRRGLGNVETDIILRGTSYPAVSTSLTASYPVQRDEVLALALEFLTLLSRTPQDAATNAKLMQERIRTGGDYAYPNQRRVI